MPGYPIRQTKKQRPESWRAFAVRPLEVSAIANPRRRRFRNAYSCRSGISGLLHTNRIDRLCFAGGRRKGNANQRQFQSENQSSPEPQSKTNKKKKKHKKIQTAEEPHKKIGQQGRPS